ncbi:MAG: diguanylate cyclase [Myxococcales bacterium]|nr:diguanylate cyclase [Myxococcales bacterium]
MAKSDPDFIEPRDDALDPEERTAVVNLSDLGRSSIPAGPNRHILVRMDSTHVGRVLTLEQEEYRLGRHPTCTVVFADDGVSRRHARIVRDGDGYLLEDLGSANGTFVAGERVERHRLADGDVFQLGPNVMFRYTFTDASQERMLNKLYEASVRDALTGAYNREHFEERLKMEVAYATRHHTLVALVMFDLDHFKKVNDSFGHPTGDRVLIDVAARVAQGLRTEDVFCRYGGEEFAIILRGIDLEGARAVAERVRERVAATPVQHGDTLVSVTLSAGCAALACCEKPTTVTLVAIADRRLYQAKRSGRNRVVAQG